MSLSTTATTESAKHGPLEPLDARSCPLRARSLVASPTHAAGKRVAQRHGGYEQHHPDPLAAVPTLALMALYRRADSVSLAVADIPPFVAGVGLWHKAVDAGLVASAHARGLAVYPWTVNEAQEATRLLALEVDAVVTDTPDVVVAARDAEAASARRFPG